MEMVSEGERRSEEGPSPTTLTASTYLALACFLIVFLYKMEAESIAKCQFFRGLKQWVSFEERSKKVEMAAAQSERHSEGESPCSLITVTTPPSTLRRSPYQTLAERKKKDTCFRCGKQGHWAQDCLSSLSTTNPSIHASPQSSTPPPSPPLDIHHVPVLNCHCGVACTICVSRSDANPGRRYYVRNCNCGNAKPTQGRSFYKWCDDVKAPMCKCGAGACTINIMRDENGKDIKFYTCRIKTGHGSCGFFQLDSPPDHQNSRPSSTKIDERPSILSPPCGGLPIIQTQEDECLTPCFPNSNIVVREAEETCNFVTGKGQRASCLTSQSDIRSRQIEFWNQISAAGHAPNGCKVLRIMGLHVNGWVGRLAFPPPRFLPDPPLRHFFCFIFPLFDPLLVSEHADISDSQSSSIPPHAFSNAEVDEVSQKALRNDTELLGVPSGTSSHKRSFTALQVGVTNPILKEVGNNLQKDLLTHLESMDLPDHNTMMDAVNDTFNALVNPLIECGPFAERLVESIRCPSIVARTEATLQDDSNQQVLSVPKNIEKHLYDISSIHAEAFATLTASRYYLQSVREAASHIKDMLRHIEKLETFLLDTARNLGQSKRSIEATCQELTKAVEPSTGERRANAMQPREALD